MRSAASILAIVVSAGLLAVSAQSADAQDAVAGKRVFNKCMACHAVGPSAANKYGPELNGLFGRPAGSVPGYPYSEANRKSGIVWTEDVFREYIKSPRTFLKGTRMAFTGLKSEKEISDLVAYLQTFDAEGN